MPPAGSTRWCPTPEQLMILEDLYRGGIRTPSSIQIQKITTNLSLYGKIESKNVFYWFQNHKARDRQKLRMKLLRQQKQHHTHHQVFLHQIESSSSAAIATPAALQQLPLHNQAHFLPQGRESLTDQVMMGCYGWKTMDGSAGVEMEKPDMMCGQDWMTTKMMMMMNASRCCNRPPRTLQLFPITNKDLKDECTTCHQHLSSSTSTTN